jgi:hypothetical protein
MLLAKAILSINLHKPSAYISPDPQRTGRNFCYCMLDVYILQDKL